MRVGRALFDWLLSWPLFLSFILRVSPSHLQQSIVISLILLYHVPTIVLGSTVVLVEPPHVTKSPGETAEAIRPVSPPPLESISQFGINEDNGPLHLGNSAQDEGAIAEEDNSESRATTAEITSTDNGRVHVHGDQDQNSEDLHGRGEGSEVSGNDIEKPESNPYTAHHQQHHHHQDNQEESHGSNDVKQEEHGDHVVAEGSPGINEAAGSHHHAPEHSGAEEHSNLKHHHHHHKDHQEQSFNEKLATRIKTVDYVLLLFLVFVIVLGAVMYFAIIRMYDWKQRRAGRERLWSEPSMFRHFHHC